MPSHTKCECTMSLSWTNRIGTNLTQVKACLFYLLSHFFVITMRIWCCLGSLTCLGGQLAVECGCNINTEERRVVPAISAEAILDSWQSAGPPNTSENPGNIIELPTSPTIDYAHTGKTSHNQLGLAQNNRTTQAFHWLISENKSLFVYATTFMGIFVTWHY